MNLKKYTSEFSTSLKIAYPIMLGQLGQVLVSLADNVMVGTLGYDPLAAVSLANGVVFIFLSLGIGFSFSITTLSAEADAKKDIKSGRSIFKHGILLTTIFGIIISVLLLFAEPIMLYFDQPANVVALASPYYNIIIVSMVPAMLFQGIKQFCDGLSLTKYAMRAAIIANLVNVLINYVFIHGSFGLPKLGIVGVGYGTVISRFLMVGIMIYYMLTHERFKLFSRGINYFSLEFSFIKNLFKIGYPTALQMWFEVNLFIATVFLAGMLGAQEQAANQISLNLISITFMIAIGLGVTATIRVGNQKGLKDYKELRRITYSLFLLTLIIFVFFSTVLILFKDFFPGMYTEDSKVIEIGVTLLVIASFFQISDGIQVVVLGALRGLQDVVIPMVICFIAYWIIGFPISYYLGFYTDLASVGIWIGLLVSLTASATMLYFRFDYLSKKLIRENTTPVKNKKE